MATDAQVQLEAFDRSRPLADKAFRSLCYAPFVQLSFSPNGDVSACCASRSHVLGNVVRERLDDIWQGEPMREFRGELRAYRFPTGCGSCAWLLKAGDSHMIRQFDVLPVASEEPWPLRFEFALSNTCNLGCIMCSGELSSVLRAREGLPPLPRAYDEQFFADLERYLPRVQELNFLGGEPFLQKECFRIWDRLIERGLHPVCEVVTNGSVWNERVERVLHELPIDITVSMDGATRETVESIRVGIDYDALMTNLERFAAYVGGTSDRHSGLRRRHLLFNHCVMQQNWRELPELFLLAESVEARVGTLLVTHPRHCSLFALPADELRAVQATLEAATPSLLPQLVHNAESWRSLMAELRTHAPGDYASEVQAVVDASRLEARSRPDGPASGWQAWALLVQGRREEALQAALETPASDPRYFSARVLIGMLCCALGEPERAERAVEEALALTTRRPDPYLCRAWLRYREGRLAEGLAEVAIAEERVRRLGHVEETTLDVLHVTAAALLFRSGDEAGAVARLEHHFAAKAPGGAPAEAFARLRPYLPLASDDHAAEELFRRVGGAWAAGEA